MSAETVLLAPGREDLRVLLLKLGCKVREEDRGYTPVLIAVRAFPLISLWLDAAALELNDEQVGRLRGECKNNCIRIVVAGDNEENNDVWKLVLFLAGMESEHKVSWLT